MKAINQYNSLLMDSSILSFVSTIAIEVVKPSSPTPSTLRFHKLSIAEQGQTHTYMPIAVFYPKEKFGYENSNDPTQISPILARALSRNLVLYYPYAGILRDNATVECDDSGAKLIHVSINRPMLEIRDNPNSDIKDLIFPRGLGWANDSPHGLAVTQVSYFSCGGIAISVCLSHKIGDAYTGYHFLNDWATIARDPYNAESAVSVPPYFVQDSIFPSPPGIVVSQFFGSHLDGCTQKKFVLPHSTVSALKAYISKISGVKNPTRVEVISALVFRALVSAAKARSGSFLKSTLTHYVNLRELITPKLPSKTVGNLLSNFSITIGEEGDMNLANIVSLMRNEKELFYSKDCVKENKWITEMIELAREGGEPSYLNDSNEYTFSSILHPVYAIDFGLGRGHGRMSTANGPMNKTVLISDQGVDMELFVTLDKEEMFEFERNKELLQFVKPVQGIMHLSML